MNERPKPSAVIFVKNVELLSTFYREVIHMTELVRDKDHVVLESDVFQLVLHGFSKKIADSIVIAEPPEVREDSWIKICFPVDSIEQARSKAKEYGGQIGEKKKAWEARGFRACDGYDPEGNVFQVREGALR